MSCDCKTCSKLDEEDRNRALKEWQDGERDVVIEHWDWECGDGCCSEYGTEVYANGYNLGVDGDNVENTLHGLLEFLGYEDVHIEEMYDDNYKNFYFINLVN